MPDVPLSYSAEELLAVLERAVPPSAPAGLWLSALVVHDPASLAGTVSDTDLQALVNGATSARAPAVTRPRVTARASRLAGERGASVAKAADVAGALLELAREDSPEPVPEPVPEPEGPETEGPVTEGPVTEGPEPAPAPEPPAGRGVWRGGRSRTFRVFVSSTFEDFVVERNVLRTDVWPALRDLCREYGARFQPVDLRWGISEEAALDQQTMNICLGEIERCQQVTPRPDFLVLLGNRYGWRPPPPQIPASELGRLLERLRAQGEDDAAGLVEQWYRRDDNAVPPEYRLRRRTGDFRGGAVWAPVEQRLARALADAADGLDDLTEEHRRRYTYSATAQEIARGALDVDDPDQAVAFVREIAPVERSRERPARWSRYVDDDQTALTELKTKVVERLTDRVIAAPHELAYGADAPVYDAAYLEAFAREVRGALAASIRAELEHPRTAAQDDVATGPLEGEVRAHRTFAAERRAHFTGRQSVLVDIGSHLVGADRRPLVVHGEGGCGKSALLAEVVGSLDADGPADALVLARFVGATPASVDGRALLTSLCEELARAAGDTTPVPSNLSDLVADFTRRLDEVSASRPVVVVVDSLDQLAGAARSLSWVPRVLPARARMVLSTRSGPTLDPLRDRARLLELGGLTRTDGERLLRAWLGAAAPPRTLQASQLDAVVDAFEASRGNPLYLRLAFEEARRWVSDEPPERLAVGVRELIRENLFERLASEDNHGHDLVRTALGYLAAAREGLAEDELTDLLSRDLPLYRHVLLHAYHVPEDLVDCAEASRLRPSDQAALGWLTGLTGDARAGVGAGLDALLEAVVPAGADRPRPGPELPAALWSRLSFDLAPYLAERGTENGALLSFYHRELQEVAAEEFLTGDDGVAVHARMADYFRELADPRGDGTWSACDASGRRGLSELPHHLVHAGRLDDVTDVLTDFTFLEQKATHVGVVDGRDGERLYAGVYALEADYGEALAAMGGPAVDRPRPIVTAVDLGEGLVVRCPHCNTVHPLGRPCEVCGVTHLPAQWRGREMSCPAPQCGGPLRVNDFVVAMAGGGRA